MSMISYCKDPKNIHVDCTITEDWLRTDAISFHLCFSWQEK